MNEYEAKLKVWSNKEFLSVSTLKLLKGIKIYFFKYLKISTEIVIKASSDILQNYSLNSLGTQPWLEPKFVL